MNMYAWWQWLLFFYFYCLMGWIWESLYVSAKQKRWVNRGFLHLPLLPLYGSGAVVVLFVCLPFQQHPLAVYVAGMLAATCLELVTGLSMEALYKVKYWDYTTRRINYRGVICLEASLLWGVFSLVMVKLVHTPVSHMLLRIPAPVIWIGELLVSVAFLQDFYVSNRDALSLARVLTSMEKAKADMEKELHRMEEEIREHQKALEAHLAEARAHAREEAEERILEALIHTEEVLQRTREARHRLADTASLLVAESREKMEQKAAEQIHKVDHAFEGVRLNALFRHQEFRERMDTYREVYLEQQRERMAYAERLSRRMILGNPTARAMTSRDINHMLHARSQHWLEETKKRSAEKRNKS